jgi:hypothetical protein
MISDFDWLREPDFDLRPAVIERSPRAVIYNLIFQLSWLREPDFDLRPVVIKRSPRATFYNHF